METETQKYKNPEGVALLSFFRSALLHETEGRGFNFLHSISRVAGRNSQ